MPGQRDGVSLMGALFADQTIADELSSTTPSREESVQPNVTHSQAIGHAAYYRRTNVASPRRRVSPIQALLKHILERSRVARSAEESKKFNNSLPPTNLLALPEKVLKNIFSFVFEGAKLTYDPNGIVADPEDAGNQFRRENMSTGILHVCSKMRNEAVPVLISNLTIDAGLGGPDFDMLLTPATRLGVQQIFNLKPDYAVGYFRNMKLWMWEMKCILNARFMEGVIALDSRALFEKVLVIYRLDDEVSTTFLGQEWLERQQGSFVGKVTLQLCYLIDEVDEALLHLSSEADECNTAHDEIGHVYLNFVERRAILDMGDVLGVEACMGMIA